MGETVAFGAWIGIIVLTLTGVALFMPAEQDGAPRLVDRLRAWLRPGGGHDTDEPPAPPA